MAPKSKYTYDGTTGPLNGSLAVGLITAALCIISFSVSFYLTIRFSDKNPLLDPDAAKAAAEKKNDDEQSMSTLDAPLTEGLAAIEAPRQSNPLAAGGGDEIEPPSTKAPPRSTTGGASML